jgi:hypothetical protein
MALTGALQADYADYVAETQKATAALAQMEAGAKTAGTTFAKTGQQVDGFGGTAGKSGAEVTKLTTGLRSVDASLNAMGVSISKPIAALEEISAASGKTAAELGTLGTAAAVAGAAFAGWNLGRWIADLTGSDEAIGNAVASLLGWRDAGQAAANNADVLARAYRELGLVTTDVHKASEALRKASLDNAAAMATATNRQAAWFKEIRDHRAELPAIEAALEAHAGTTAQLAKEYGISAAALEYYLARKKDQSAAEDEATRKTTAAAAAQQKLQDSLFGFDLIAKAQAYVDALAGIENITGMSTAKQLELNTALGGAIDAYGRLGATAPEAMRAIYTATLPLPPITAGLTEEWNNVGESVNVNADAIIADLKRMEDETKAYEAETQRIVDEWNQVKPPIDASTGAVQQQTAAVGQLTVQMQNFGRVNQSVWESMASGMELMEAYSKAGVAMGTQTALGGYNFQNITAPGVTPTSASAARSLTVTVNNASAQDIAERLTTEMRHSGVRF